MSTNYTGEQIEVLRGLEAVRKRPGMYIGNTAERGLHQLVYEAVDNAVDEALAGYATQRAQSCCTRTLAARSKTTAAAFPIDIHAEEKLPAVEVVMTMLHAGGEVRQRRLQGFGRSARRRHLGRQRALRSG